MQWTVWLRIPGDIIFTVGAMMLVYCVGRAVVGIFQQPTQAQPTEEAIVATSVR
jgi:nitric oxide reductase subunit B